MNPNAQELQQLNLLETLPLALKKKEPEFPHLLELRTRKNFHQSNPSHGHYKHSSNATIKDEIREQHPTDKQSKDQEEPTNTDIEELEGLKKVYSFMIDNKYVIEAIFENVLLENNMYRFPLSNVNDTERKQLMEKLLSNDEFKEYLYQKIIKGQEFEDEGKPKHLLSDAMTQDEGEEVQKKEVN